MTTFKEIFVLFLKKKKILSKFKHYSTSKNIRIRGCYAENDIFADLKKIEKENLDNGDMGIIANLLTKYFLWVETNEGHCYWSQLSEDWEKLLFSKGFNAESLKKNDYRESKFIKIKWNLKLQ